MREQLKKFIIHKNNDYFSIYLYKLIYFIIKNNF